MIAAMVTIMSVYQPLIHVLRFKPQTCYKPRRGWTWGKSGWWSRSRL